jgi:hypothetical protein
MRDVRLALFGAYHAPRKLREQVREEIGEELRKLYGPVAAKLAGELERLADIASAGAMVSLAWSCAASVS